MRPIAVQNSYILNLRSEFASKVYAEAALRARGISCECETNSITPIFLDQLQDYQNYGNITPDQADLLIDYLVKINN